MKIGNYEPNRVKKGYNETHLKLKEGETFWVVQIEKDVQMDVITQTEAEIISRLVRIENKMKKRV